jgi:hypothetical protein
MEYLMTYGWAILVIAVVLGVMYTLGVFNPINYAPKAQPGSCQVFRPNGPGTSYDVNLQGTCSGELPQYVATFNGRSSYIDTGASDLPLGSAPRSAFAWVYYTGIPANDYFTVESYGNQSKGTEAVGFRIQQTSGYMDFVGAGDDFQTTFIPSDGVWNFVGYTYNGGTGVTVYYDSQSQTGTIGSPLDTTLPKSDIANIGKSTANNLWYWQGYIADVQIYNTSLSANEVSALYNEGIGGAPIKPQNVVGWWPLDGNANDYSGNNNNGVPTAVSYTGSWQSGYTAP